VALSVDQKTWFLNLTVRHQSWSFKQINTFSYYYQSESFDLYASFVFFFFFSSFVIRLFCVARREKAGFFSLPLLVCVARGEIEGNIYFLSFY